eukprot:5094-Heterococcus_DN1.PRE.5
MSVTGASVSGLSVSAHNGPRTFLLLLRAWHLECEQIKPACTAVSVAAVGVAASALLAVAARASQVAARSGSTCLLQWQRRSAAECKR